MIQAEITGMRELLQSLDKVDDIAKAQLSKAVDVGLLMIESRCKKRINQGTKSGIMYYRTPGEKYMIIRSGSAEGPPVAFPSGSGKQNLSATHRASAPGQSPAGDTGNLVSQMRVEKSKGGLTGFFVSGAKYSWYLEHGTRKIKARPFVYPSFKEEIPAIMAEFKNILAKALQRKLSE